MKILVLAHSVAWPIHDGYVLRLHHLTRRLAARHDLHLLCLADGPPAAPLAAPFRSVRALPRRAQLRRRSAWQRLLHALDPDDVHDFDPDVHAALLALLATESRFDVVLVCGTKMLGYTRRLDGRVPVVADVADDDVLACRNRFLSAPPRQRPRALLDWVRSRRFQRAALPHAALTTVVAEPDRASILARHPQLDVRVVVNGVDFEQFVPAPAGGARGVAGAGAAGAARLVFEGNMGFAPNVEAAVHLVRRILPLVREQLPDVTVQLVGRDPAPEVAALAGPGVEVTGRVEDVVPWLQRATVFVCPLLSGTGIKNKILQAWATALPVVATSISTGGLEARPGQNLLVADTARAFAEAVVRLVRDPELRARLGAAGRATVLARHGWDTCTRQLEGLLLAAVCRAAPRPDLLPAAAQTARDAPGYGGGHEPAPLASRHP
jgi:polysaccharide biosynthesis protein PslH